MHIISLWWPARKIGCLRCYIAAKRPHRRAPSSCPALTSRQFNLADGKRAQSGEKSVPDDFLLLCSPLLSADTPPHPSHRPNVLLSSLSLPLLPPALPPSASLRPLLSPDTQTPSHHSVAHVISGACLASPSHLTSHPPLFCFLASLHPNAPPPPHRHPRSIPAWQTTRDFTSPFKSAASGNRSSSCNILVFGGIRDRGSNQRCYISTVFFRLLLLGIFSSSIYRKSLSRYLWLFFSSIKFNFISILCVCGWNASGKLFFLLKFCFYFNT